MPVGLNLLIYGDVFRWGQLMAASVITTLPVVALYVFIHRWMVEGLVAGSVKGSALAAHSQRLPQCDCGFDSVDCAVEAAL